MGLIDKFKSILFDEEDEIEELPKKEPKKNKLKNAGFKDYSDQEDTIKEVKVPEDNEDKFDFDGVDYSSISRTRLREEEYKEVEHDVIDEVKVPERPQVIERPVQSPVERPQVVQTQVVRPETNTSLQPNVDRRKYELPPQREVDYGPRDMSKYINQDTQRKSSKPFVVTPVISPVYGILDKNYKPEEIAEKNKPQEIEQVRERMFGPVSYEGEDIPEPTKYEESTDSLTELLIKEEKAKRELQKIQEEKAQFEVEEEFDTTSEYETVEPQPVEEVIQNIEEVTPEVEEPTNDISDLINSIHASDYAEDTEEEVVSNNNEIEEDYYRTESPSDFDEMATYETVTRNDEVKESLDDTIETDLFNLIDSMYNTDEGE